MYHVDLSNVGSMCALETCDVKSLFHLSPEIVMVTCTHMYIHKGCDI